MDAKNWIDVNDELPKAGGQDRDEWGEALLNGIDISLLSVTAVVWCKEGDGLHFPLRRGYYNHETKEWEDEDSGGKIRGDVTHWQPFAPPLTKE